MSTKTNAPAASSLAGEQRERRRTHGVYHEEPTSVIPSSQMPTVRRFVRTVHVSWPHHSEPWHLAAEVREERREVRHAR